MIDFFFLIQFFRTEKLEQKGENMKKGFTLIELLVVVLIIGILSAVALPQYQKAVVKARFSEAMLNLKSLAQAHKVCYLEKGEACHINELSINIGDIFNKGAFQTKDFRYFISDSYVKRNLWAVAHYYEEDVCLCYRGDGEFVIFQEPDYCDGPAEHAMDYAKLLNLPEVDSDGCSCC